ncbi:MAG: heme o synthase [Oligoflexia bacterium]|nr:heme o synthase [Oligoflexia bacterium]
MNLSAYLSLCKPRIVTLVLVTHALGYFLGGKGIASYETLFCALFGTGLACAGAGALNCYLERDVDALMKRTMKRPLPSGVISPIDALTFGVLLVLFGTVFLVWQVNLLTGFLALLTAFLYTHVYTPLKRITWLNTLVGAIPGALPPMGGWSAATGEVSLGAWILFLILFLWQHPHFYAIAWMFRDDYARAGIKMLPCVEPDGASTFRQVLLCSALLIPASLLPTIIGMSGYVYLCGALVLGLVMMKVALMASQSRSIADARSLLRASVVYLPILLVLIVADASF